MTTPKSIFIGVATLIRVTRQQRKWCTKMTRSFSLLKESRQLTREKHTEETNLKDVKLSSAKKTRWTRSIKSY
jgi:hypothetical protein